MPPLPISYDLNNKNPSTKGSTNNNLKAMVYIQGKGHWGIPEALSARKDAKVRRGARVGYHRKAIALIEKYAIQIASQVRKGGENGKELY